MCSKFPASFQLTVVLADKIFVKALELFAQMQRSMYMRSVKIKSLLWRLEWGFTLKDMDEK